MSTAILIELLRNVLSNNNPPSNPIIFLLNNGEEMGLLGATSFMNNKTFWAGK